MSRGDTGSADATGTSSARSSSRLLVLARRPRARRRDARARLDAARRRELAAAGHAADPVPTSTWRESRSVGKPFDGRLVDGVQLPAEGVDFWTYDWGTRASPNRPWRRWGTDRLVRTVLDVLREYRARAPVRAARGHRRPVAPARRPLRQELRRARPRLAPERARRRHPLPAHRRPRAPRPGRPPGRRAAAQDLVDAFVAAGAVYVFTGPRLHLRGPRKIVVQLVHHDDHMHVRVR